MKVTYLGALGTAAVFALVINAGLVHAKDAVRATIGDANGGIVTANGGFQTPGTYALGTLRIDYPIVGYQYPADGVLRTFELCLDVVGGKAKPATAYPANVNVRQIGSPDVELDLSTHVLTFAAGDVDNPDSDSKKCIDIDISVPAAVANDPDFQENGTELVANIQLSTAPRTHLDTVTTVKVHLTLVHPSDVACIVPLHLVANLGLNTDLSSTGIALQAHTSNGLNTNHQGRHVLALVNACADARTIDLATWVNENFALQSADAVETTTTNQQFVDIDELLDANLTFDSSHGTAMCLKGVTVQGNRTFVVRQHLRMIGDAKFPGGAGLPKQTLSDWFYNGFAYTANAHDADAACASLPLSHDVDPNQGEVSIPITEVSYNGPSDTEYPPAP